MTPSASSTEIKRDSQHSSTSHAANGHHEPQVPPQGQVMQLVMGAWISQTISAVTRLDVPDIIHKHGPLTARELVEKHGVKANADFLQRALRACASVGLFTESAAGVFGATALSEPLTLTSLVSVKKITEIFGRSWWRIWGGMEDALRTGEPQAKAALGMEYWDYCQANPKEMEDFGEAMKSNSLASIAGVLEHCDLSGAKMLVDVAGGFGHLAIALLKKYPNLKATVLDMPGLIPIAQKHAATEDKSVLARLNYVGGDMFEDVPAGDVYIMKHIIHDWDDDRCITLLKHCCNRMQGDGTVYCVDSVLPPMGDTGGTAAKFLDMNMLVNIPGKERTEAQWRALFDASGLKVMSMTPLHDNFGTSIVEARKTEFR